MKAGAAAIDCSKLKGDLGWSQPHRFDEGPRNTVRWYLEHRKWVQSVRTGEYGKWIEANHTPPAACTGDGSRSISARA